MITAHEAGMSASDLDKAIFVAQLVSQARERLGYACDTIDARIQDPALRCQLLAMVAEALPEALRHPDNVRQLRVSIEAGLVVSIRSGSISLPDHALAVQQAMTRGQVPHYTDADSGTDDAE